MNTIKQVMTALEKAGNPLRIQVFAKHGAPLDRMFGVSVADMKVIAKQIKGRQELAYELFESMRAPEPTMGTDDTHVSCVRCNARLEYVETTQIVQREGALNVLPAALLASSDPIEIFACSKCGHVELFLERRGDAMRGRAKPASASRALGRAAGRLLGRRSPGTDDDAGSETQGP